MCGSIGSVLLAASTASAVLDPEAIVLGGQVSASYRAALGANTASQGLQLKLMTRF